MARIYCYDGDCGLTANQLLWIIASETAMEELGLDDVAAAFGIVTGANIIPTRTKPGGATKNTSILSLLLRRALKKRRFPGGYRAPSIVGWRPPHIRRTPSIAAFIARAIPVAGWAYTAAELGLIGYKTVVTYNSIVSTEDQVF
ncbi:STM2901 family protein [Pseudomonas huanghezhanensis]|uniref:STM2901 family protein n=1 Tax=Pseudomonas huanghezhanensis TaxID=3002903 RepID=UPI0038B4FF41